MLRLALIFQSIANMTLRQDIKSVVCAFRKGLTVLSLWPLLFGLLGTVGVLIYLEWATHQGTLLSGFNGAVIESLPPSGTRSLSYFNKNLITLSQNSMREPQLYVAGGSALDYFLQTATLPRRGPLRLKGGINFQFHPLINHGFSSSILSVIADNLAEHGPNAILLGISPYTFGKNPSYYVFNESIVILGKAETLTKSLSGTSFDSPRFLGEWPRSLVFLGRLYLGWCSEKLQFKSMHKKNLDTVESVFLRNILPAFDVHFERDKALFLRSLQVLKAKGVKVILLEMPMSPAFLRPRPDQVQKYVKFTNELRNLTGVSYLELLKDAPVRNSDFSDGIHLTKESAERLLPSTLGAIKEALEAQFELTDKPFNGLGRQAAIP